MAFLIVFVVLLEAYPGTRRALGNDNQRGLDHLTVTSGYQNCAVRHSVDTNDMSGFRELSDDQIPVPGTKDPS